MRRALWIAIFAAWTTSAWVPPSALAQGEPGGGTPAEGTPGEGTPGEGTPADGAPGGGTPGEGTPGEATPGEGTPPEGPPGEGAPDHDETLEDEGDAFEPPPLAIDPEQAQRRASELVREALDAPAYEFCHDEDFESAGVYGDRRFCKVWTPEALAACPEARAVCAEKEPSAWEKFQLELPPWLGWTVLGAALLVVLYFFVRALMSHEGSPELDLGDAVSDALAGELAALPEAPALVILRKAKEAYAAGRAEDAAILAQLACLRYFEDHGLVAFHPSRTNGEYLRAVRRRSAPHAELYRQITGETDRVRFGSGVAARALVEACLDDAARLLATPPPPEPILGGFGGLGGTTAALLVLLASGAQSGCGTHEKPYYSHKPSGMAALVSLLRGLELPVTVGSYALGTLPDDTGVVVVESSAIHEVEKLVLDELLDRSISVVVIDDAGQAEHILPVRTSSAQVVRLPMLGSPISLGPERPEAETVYTHDSWACGVNLALLDARLGPRRLRLPVGSRLAEADTATSSLSVHPWSITPTLLVDHGRAEMAARAYAALRVDKELGYFRDGCVWLFGDGDLFTNAGLAIPQNAAFVGGLFASITPENRRVVLVDALRDRAVSDSGMARSVAASRMLPFLVQGLVWVAVLFVFLGAAFGPLRDPVRVQHKAFVEHVEALGRQYLRLGTDGQSHIARSLGKFLVMRHRVDVKSNSGWLAVARHLSEKHQLPEDDVRVALRLGLDGANAAELGAAVTDEQARSAPILRALAVLVSGRTRAWSRDEQKVRRR